MQDYLLDSNKIYEFDIEFVGETTSLDADGEVLERCEYSHVTKEAIDKACEAIVGQYIQTPPLYSAIKYKGKHTSMQEREGLRGSLDLLKKTVNIFSCVCSKFENDIATITIECSKELCAFCWSIYSKKCDSLATTVRLLRSKVRV